MKNIIGFLLAFFSLTYISAQCVGGSTVTSLLPNPMFENNTCCPSNHSQMNCVNSWDQASSASTDYLNTCGYTATGLILAAPTPYPSGTGCVGIFDGSNNAGLWKEHIGTCLTTPLLAGTSYTLEFSIVAGIGAGSFAGNTSNLTRDFVIYGAGNCTNLPFAGTGCPTAGWNVVHAQTVTMSATAWSTVTFTFTPTFDIYGFIFGGNCANVTGNLTNGQGSSTAYYYLDDMILNTTTLFGPPMPPVANAGTDINTSCGTGSTTLMGSASGGAPAYTYSWSNGAGTSPTATVSPASTTNYTLTVTDSNGCTDTDEVLVSVVASVTGTDIISSCTSITWIDGNNYAVSNNTATHTIVGGAVNGCDSIVTLDLTVSPSLSGTDVQVACGAYTWIDGVTYTASNNTAMFTLVNSTGCDSIVTLDLTIDTGVPGIDTQARCGQYTWIDGVTYFASNNTATYTISGGSATGCDSTVILDLTINPLPLIFAGLDQSLCDGDPVILNATGVTDIIWSPVATNNVPFVQPIGTVVYTATGTSANGCIGTDDVTITVNDLPNPSFSFTNVCEGNSMDFVSTSNVNNGTITNSDWSFGDATPGTGNGLFTNYLYSTAGVYDVTLTVTSNSGCVNSVINTVEIYENPIADFSSLNAEGCADLCVNFDNNSSATSGVITDYLWTLGNGNVDITANPVACYVNNGLTNQGYDVTLTVTTDLGCVATSNQPGFVTVYPIPVADFTPSAYETTVLTPSIDFENESTLGFTYTWNFFGTGISIEEHPTYLFPDEDTATYEVCLEVVSANGCIDDTCQLINITGFEGVYIPNAFSPNDDGKNELFQPQLEGILDTEFRFMIFNRWGELIYESTDPKDVVWDGTHKGLPVQVDTYIWKLEGVFSDSRNPIDKTGHVIIIR